jgi:lactate racemase
MTLIRNGILYQLAGNNVRKIWKGRAIAMLQLPYGKDEIRVELDPSCRWDTIMYNGRTEGSADSMIRQALEQPIGSPRLQTLAHAKANAVIVISDISRLCPSYLFLPYLLEELNNGGVPDENITIIVALGLHRKQTREELSRLVGPSILQRVRVENHSAVPEDCVSLGSTTLGTPIEVNKKVAEAELLIITGNIEPHALAGMSGGVKAVIPGTASWRCIEKNHSLSQKYPSEPGLVDNVVRRDMEEAARAVPIDFLFNVIVNHRRELIAAVAGHPTLAHQEGIAAARSRFLVPAARAYDLVIASPGGHPKDMQLYQAVKSLVNASKIAVPGGTIVLVAHCEELFGNGIFQYWTEVVQDRARMVRMLKEQFVIGAHKIEHIDKVLSKHRVLLYSCIPRSTVELIGFEPVDNLQEMIPLLIKQSRIGAAVMPYASITFPQVH